MLARGSTVDTSKAMVEYPNRPLMEFIVLLDLVSQGIKEVHFGVSGYTNHAQLFDLFGSDGTLLVRYKDA